MEITRNLAEALIVEIYSQFAENLHRLYSIVPKDNRYPLNYEQKEISNVYRGYCNAFGVTDLNHNMRKKILQDLCFELEIKKNNEIIETLTECRELAKLYKLSIYNDMPKGEIIICLDNINKNHTTMEKLISQVRKFGDEKMTECLAEIKSGQRKIVFEEMEEGTEGHTKLENGSILHRLNKKYEKANNEEDLWKASIILVHELQRNPATGDLREETAEIVLHDLDFIEKLAVEYGERVYENNPEFAVLRNVKKLCGENGLREFADMVFNHKGSYWDWEAQYWEDYENLDFWSYDEIINEMYHDTNALFAAMAAKAQEKIEAYAKFMNRNGYTIALVCYASGLVKLGIIIDAMTLTIDITLIHRKYEETGNLAQYYLDLSFILLNLVIPYRIGKMISKMNFMPKEFMEKITPFISSLIGITAAEIKELLDRLRGNR
jgi:hypothetical protein